MRLAVSGAQPLFTLGLLMFALSLVDFLALLLSPSTYFNIFYFCQKYHFNYIYKIFKKFHVGLKFEWGLWDQYWLSCERLLFEVFFSCLCEGLPGIAYANMLVTTQWPLKRAATSPHLSGFVFYGCLESLTELSALCGQILLQDDTRNIYVLVFGACNVRGLRVSMIKQYSNG